MSSFHGSSAAYGHAARNGGALPQHDEIPVTTPSHATANPRGTNFRKSAIPAIR